MRGVFVTNSFLAGGKYEEPWKMLSEAASRHGVDLIRMTNGDLMVPLGSEELLAEKMGDADFVLFWDKDTRCATNLEICGYRVFNPSECIATCDDKSKTHLALRKHGIPSIETIVCPLAFDGYPDLGFLDRAVESLGFPMVVKDCFGSFGQQVHLAHDTDSLVRLFDGPYVPRILQRYVECGGRDRRLEVVGGRVVASMERKAREGDFRSNTTLGGSMTSCGPSSEEREIAIAACEAVGADFAGVDIMDDMGTPVVCEVNSNAHIKNLRDCTGIDVSDLIINHVVSEVRR